MGLLGNVIGGVIASRMAGRGGPLGGALGGAVLGGMGGGRRGGSPVMKGLMLILAAKAAQSYMERRAQGPGGTSVGQAPGGPGGLLGGVAGGGGLGALVEQFKRAGYGDAVNSWIQPGPNRKLAPNELAQALGPETVQALKAETGMEEDELLGELSETLPETVDQLTPDGVQPDPKLLQGDDDDLAIGRASAV